MLWLGKTYTAKSPPDDFKFTIPKNSLLSKQAVTSKGIQYLIPTYSWTLTLIPNWICSVVTISHFQCTALSTWLTNRCADHNTWLDHQLEKDVGCKVLQFIQMVKIKKLFDHKILRCTNTTAYSRERRTRANSVSGLNLHEQDFASHSYNLCNLWRPSK